MNFSIYTKNPVPNAPEFKKVSRLTKTQKYMQEESQMAKTVRRRMIDMSKDGQSLQPKTVVLTKTQREEQAKQEVLHALNDDSVLDKSEITQIFYDWAANDLGIAKTECRKIFSTPIVTSATSPNQNVYKVWLTL